jgi:translation initiation factor IF-2
MTDSNDQTDKTIRVGARKPLSLQRTVESGHVRQNFSHGRSKSVVVEKKRTRRLGPGSEAADTAAAAPVTEKAKPAAKAPATPPAKAPASTQTQS